MNLANRWKKSENPYTEVISALVARIINLEQKLQAHLTSTSSNSSKPKLHIPVWRTGNNGEMRKPEE